MELLSLFCAAFLSASLLPLQSELLFIALVVQGHYSSWLVLAAASAGNTLGSVLNWWLGQRITQFEHKRWFPVKRAAMAKAEHWFARWGNWSLLLSWMPVVGDPLTLVAGVLRMRLVPFVLVVGLAKTARYAALMLLI